MYAHLTIGAACLHFTSQILCFHSDGIFRVNPEITPVLTMALKVFVLYYVNIIDFSFC